MGQRLQNWVSGDRDTVWLSALVETFTQLDVATNGDRATLESDDHTTAAVMAQLQRPVPALHAINDSRRIMGDLHV